MVPTFLARTHNGNTRLVCRETGDVFYVVCDLLVWRVYINGCYDTFRNSREEAIARVESEARIAMR